MGCRIVVLGLEVDAGRCTGCRLCVELCPTRALEMAGGVPRLRDRDLCLACLGCMAVCDQRALRLRTDWVCGGG